VTDARADGGEQQKQGATSSDSTRQRDASLPAKSSSESGRDGGIPSTREADQDGIPDSREAASDGIPDTREAEDSGVPTDILQGRGDILGDLQGRLGAKGSGIATDILQGRGDIVGDTQRQMNGRATGGDSERPQLPRADQRDPAVPPGVEQLDDNAPPGHRYDDGNRVS
jgi:hypothetical protein